MTFDLDFAELADGQRRNACPRAGAGEVTALLGYGDGRQRHDRAPAA